jgi:hypothetical protein
MIHAKRSDFVRLTALVAFGLLFGCADRPADLAETNTANKATKQPGDRDRQPANDAANGPYELLIKTRDLSFAVAETRGLPKQAISEQLKALSQEMSDCLGTLARDNASTSGVAGAARVIVLVGPNGTPEGMNVAASDDPGASRSLALCVVPKLKASVFPKPQTDARTTSKKPGFALELLWPSQ